MGNECFSKTMRGIFIMLAYIILFSTSSLPKLKDDDRARLDAFQDGFNKNYQLTTKRKCPNISEQIKSIRDQTKDKKSFSSLRFNRKNDEEMLQHTYKMLSLLKKLINNP